MRRIAAIIPERDADSRGYLSALRDIETVFLESADVPADCSCVVISQKAAGSSLTKLVSEFQTRQFPVCVFTYDGSVENQEVLCDSGTDDVIVLPVSPALLEKKIGLLVEAKAPADFSFVDELGVEDKGQGSFFVQEKDFRSLYEFVSRFLERLGQKAQLLTFNMTSRFNIIEPEMLGAFASVAQRFLRRGDICCRKGAKLYVVLVGADRKSGVAVAERLLATFWGICSEDAYDVGYDIREING